MSNQNCINICPFVTDGIDCNGECCGIPAEDMNKILESADLERGASPKLKVIEDGMEI